MWSPAGLLPNDSFNGTERGIGKGVFIFVATTTFTQISVRTSAVLTEPFANGFKLNAIFLTEKRRGLKTENSHMVHDPYWISYEMVYLPPDMFIF